MKLRKFRDRLKERQLLISEVVQTSPMDCGPACLSALLGGFRLRASYGRLREACQTNVDGTCIDTLEELANQLGLEAEQIVLPADHIPIPQAAALPGIAVVKLPNGMTHFVVVWSRHGNRLQLMDPATGRRWSSVGEFAKELYSHETTVSGAEWREWTETAEFKGAIEARMLALGFSADEAARLIEATYARPGCRPVAALDAALRMAESLARSASLRKNAKLRRALTEIVKRSVEISAREEIRKSDEMGASGEGRGSDHRDITQLIPREYWSVWPAGGADDELVMRGAVVVRVKGLKKHASDLPQVSSSVSGDVAAVISETPVRPFAELWKMMREDGVLLPSVIAGAFFVSTLGVITQALIFSALIGGARELSGHGQRLRAMGLVLGLLLLLLAVDLPAITALVDMGRRLEARFRAAFLTRLPDIADRYFHSRLTSDMAERAHSVHNVRALPELGGQLLRSLFELLLTAIAIICIDPRLWYLTALLTVASVGLPLAMQSLLGEREMRVRTYGGALSRHYFDALMGILPIRTHVADGAIREEHGSLLSKWAAAGLATQKLAIGLEGAQLFVGYGLAALIAIFYAHRYPESPALLLLAYWALNIPNTGKDLVSFAREYPRHRNITLRLLEPQRAAEEANKRSEWAGELAKSEARARFEEKDEGITVSLNKVSVTLAGHTVLRDVNLKIAAGRHVAIVGSSGAGKSTLLGLLLGWHAASQGKVLMNGQAMTPERVEELRRRAVWIDPSVQIWNRSLVENLRFGCVGDAATSIGQAVEEAELTPVLERLPEGLQTPLGEGGTAVSGGEGQRVRVGRALLRTDARLVVMDEPFRGLDATARRSLLETARRTWRNATLVCVTHDLADTRGFDRVLVMEGGRIVEDGAPFDLARFPGSRYHKLIEQEIELKRDLFGKANWRRIEMAEGTPTEEIRHDILIDEERPAASAPMRSMAQGAD
jgi:ABC-type bacteriocin/lantibiotic exporter with double-glycine peptidase domain